MSADNWQKCPKCKYIAKEKKKELGKKVGISYGKVPADQYEKMLAELQAPILLEETLREDYEIGIFEDEFYISYSAHCSECGFSKKYKKEEPLSF